MLQIVRKKLTPDELSRPGVRYNVDCNCVQTTFDGGMTWVDTPGADPRIAPQYQAPGISTSDPACDGAARITAALKRSIDATIATSNAVQLASALLDVFLFIIPVIGIIAEAIYIAAVALLAIGTAAIEAAFTDEVYDQFKCLANCRLSSDGQFTPEAWEAFQSDCFDFFGAGTVSDVLQLNFDTLGIVGFNNAVSLGTETGDCSDCSCAWTVGWDFCGTLTDWTIWHGCGNLTANGIEQVDDCEGSPSIATADLIYDFGTGVVNQLILYVSDNYAPNSHVKLYAGAPGALGLIYDASNPSVPVVIIDQVFTGEMELLWIWDWGGYGHRDLISGVWLSGIGDEPTIGTPNPDLPPCYTP